MTRLLPLWALLLVLFTSACGSSAVSDAQQMIRYSGYALRDVDTEVAPLYLAAHEAALAGSEDLNAYHVTMRPWAALEIALRTSYSAFLAADQALEATGEVPLLSRVACLLGSLSTVAHALGDLELPVPQLLTQALGYAASYTGECTEPPTPAAGAVP